ncbi:MAG: hypothetical protein ACXU7D_00945 [Burkholderiaceae bacterium]
MQALDHMDVTKRIDLANPQQVCDEVCNLLCAADAGVDRPLIEHAFNVFARLYGGTLPGYHRCETLYHDMQHALDVTLATARLLAGHESVHYNGNRFGAERLTLGIIVALFHDAGYIRLHHDHTCWHGAQYTLVHVSRGARFLAQFLKQEKHEDWVKRAVKLIHFTGYEIPLDQIRLKDPLDRKLGNMIGTADLIAQMADRAYLEKCRDYLFEEFELGGLSKAKNPDGSMRVLYESGNDLLSKTPVFYTKMVKKRLDEDFGKIYHALEPLFGGANPYLQAIERNMGYLQKILDNGSLTELLRRQAVTTSQHA